MDSGKPADCNSPESFKSIYFLKLSLKKLTTQVDCGFSNMDFFFFFFFFFFYFFFFYVWLF